MLPDFLNHQAIINFATESYSTGNTAAAPPIGLGVGLAFVLLVMQVIVSLCTHHTFYRSMSSTQINNGTHPLAELLSHSWCPASWWPHHCYILKVYEIDFPSSIDADKR